MLQQTTVAAVVPYFERWMARFPTVESLAEAEPDEVDHLWAGLGYYSRCRRLHAVARLVREMGWPNDVPSLRALPGIGSYTVAAVGSIAFGWPLACVDGNVERVYSRLRCDKAVGGEIKRSAQAWADKVLCPERAGDWNQAVMELGATICRPKDPQCQSCPVSKHCLARSRDAVNDYPTAKPKREWLAVSQVIVVKVCGSSVGIRKFGKGEWWSGLWGFPRESSVDPAWEIVGTFNHVVTRHKVQATVAIQQCNDLDPDLDWCDLQNLSKMHALPVPDAKALQMVSTRLGFSRGQPSLFQGSHDEAVSEQQHHARQA